MKKACISSFLEQREESSGKRAAVISSQGGRYDMQRGAHRHSTHTSCTAQDGV